VIPSPWPTPHFTGPVGNAYRIDFNSLERDTRYATSCGMYLLHLPPAHPWWPRYMLYGVLLTELPGFAHPKRLYLEAEFEIGIAALDPEHDPRPDNYPWKTLMPLNLNYQGHGLSKGGVTALLERVAQACVTGERWVETSDRFGECERWPESLAIWKDELLGQFAKGREA